MLNNILKRFHKNTLNNKLYTNILCNEVINYYNKSFNKDLVQLNLLEENSTNSWYVDKKSTEVYNILVSSDDGNIPIIDNNYIFDTLKVKSYTQMEIYLKSLSRSSFLKDRYIYKFSVNNDIGYYHYGLVTFNKVIVNKNKGSKRTREETQLIESNHVKKNFKRRRSRTEDFNVSWENMIGASKVRNFFLSDPLIDWLQFYNITTIDDKPKKKIKNNRKYVNYSADNSFSSFIKSEGIRFEEKVYSYLKGKYNIVKVAEYYQARDEKMFNNTIELMKKGVDMLYQPIVHDFVNETYGIPDLLVRSDKINEIFGYHILNDMEANIPSPVLGTPFHYVVIDIKYSTLYLAANGKNMKNTGSIPAYKGQICIYNNAIGIIQGYTPRYSYVLGKKWEFKRGKTVTKGNSFMSRLGVIDYLKYDCSYKEQVNNALTWLRLVRNEGYKWELLPTPSRRELYPNMKNEKDGGFRGIKNKLNDELGEITSVWMCGYKKRLLAHSKGILSWKDEKCTSESLEFKPTKTSKTLDAILNINRSKDIIIDIGTLKSDSTWKTYNGIEYYIDYETMNSNFGKVELEGDQCIGYKNNDFIFMIGVGWEEKGEWKFKCFVADNNNTKSEIKMINNFWDFINENNRRLDNNKNRFIHWSPAEVLSYKKLRSRLALPLPDKNFYDLHKVLKDNFFATKGALNYSLKSIAKSMYMNGLINISWDTTSPCSNGLNAMLLAYNIYDKVRPSQTIDLDEPVMKDIIHYNEIDCRVLWEILSYLRKSY